MGQLQRKPPDLDQNLNPIKPPDLDATGNPVSEIPNRTDLILANPLKTDIPPEKSLVKPNSTFQNLMDWGNRSIFTGEDAPTPMDYFRDPRGSWERGITTTLTSPFAIGGELLGGVGLLKGLSRFKNAGKVAEEVAPEIKGADLAGEIRIKGDPNFNQGMGDPMLAGSVPYKAKPRFKINLDGTATNLDTGEIVQVPKPKFEGAPAVIPRFQGNRKGIKLEDAQAGLNNVPPNQIPPNHPPEIPPLPPDNNAPGLLQQAWDAARGLKSVDLPFITSAAFRQGGGDFGTKAWLQSWVSSAKAYGSKAAAETLETARNARKYNKPRFKPVIGADGVQLIDPKTGQGMVKEIPSIADEAGLRIGNLAKYGRRDEQIRGEWAERIPLYGRHVAASNRQFNEFINHISSTAFESMMDDAMKLGYNPDKDITLAKELAEAVNTTVKRGKLGVEIGTGLGKGMQKGTQWEASLEQHARALSNLLYSPRGIASEIRMINPSTYASASPIARQRYLSVMGRKLGMWMTFAGLAKASGASVNMDVSNPDFGKIKINNNLRVDLPGGLQQFVVFLGQQAKGGKSSSINNKFTAFGEGYKPETRTSAAGNFLRNRVHPSLDFLADLGSGTQQQPVGLFDKVARLPLPMMLDGDIQNVFRDNPDLVPLAALFNSAGIGIQDYQKGDNFNQPVIVPPKYDVNLGGK